MPTLEKNIKQYLANTTPSRQGFVEGNVSGDTNKDFYLPINTFNYHEDDDEGEGYIIVHATKSEPASQAFQRVFLALSNKVTNGRHYYTDNETILDISYGDTPDLVTIPEAIFKGVYDAASYIDIEFDLENGTLIAKVQGIKLKEFEGEGTATIEKADINAENLIQQPAKQF